MITGGFPHPQKSQQKSTQLGTSENKQTSTQMPKHAAQGFVPFPPGLTGFI
jgi:hypothetical protein